MAKALVIGANGFIGSHLVDELVRAGHEVTAFDRFSSGSVTYEASGVRQLVGDFLDPVALRSAVDGNELVFHFLSTTTPATAEADPQRDVSTNVTASIELFKACVDARVERVFFASTGGAIYGSHELDRLTETTVAEPVSPYAIGKLAIEGYLRYFDTMHGLESMSLRISNPYGPRQPRGRKQGVIPIFLQRLADDQPLQIFGDGSMVRDYLYVTDAVRMIASTLDHSSRHGIYNIGRGQGSSVSELLGTIERVTGIVPHREFTPVPSTFIERVVLDTDRFSAEFGYDRFVSLDDGIAATWEHVQAEGKK